MRVQIARMDLPISDRPNVCRCAVPRRVMWLVSWRIPVVGFVRPLLATIAGS